MPDAMDDIPTAWERLEASLREARRLADEATLLGGELAAVRAELEETAAVHGVDPAGRTAVEILEAVAEAKRRFVDRIAAERDAYLGLLVYPASDPGPLHAHFGPTPGVPGVPSRYRTRGLAVGAARRAAGLEPEAERAAYLARLRDALRALCGGDDPPGDLADRWARGEDNELQQWAANHTAVAWATGIGTIDAAEAMAREPRPGHHPTDDATPSPEDRRS